MTEKGGGQSMSVGDRFAGYQVYDRHYEKIGRVEHLFVDEHDRLEYIGVRSGLLGTHHALIPMKLVRVNDRRRLMEVEAEKGTVEAGPTFDTNEELTPELERRVYEHFGLGPGGIQTGGGRDLEPSPRTAEVSAAEYGERHATSHRESTGAGRGGVTEGRGEVGPGMRMGDTETGEFRGHGREQEGVRQPGGDLEDRDELRVQRSEEELRVGTREREAGFVRVTKRVRTEHQQVRVPKRREEVTVERVPVSGVAAEGEIGDEEILMPVVEEEVVVEKRPVVKEELRIRKDVVQEEDVVEEDLRKEEVDVIDETNRHGGSFGGGPERRDG